MRKPTGWDLLFLIFVLAAFLCAFMALRAAYAAPPPPTETKCESHVISRRADSLWLEVMCVVPPIKAGK